MRSRRSRQHRQKLAFEVVKALDGAVQVVRQVQRCRFRDGDLITVAAFFSYGKANSTAGTPFCVSRMPSVTTSFTDERVFQRVQAMGITGHDLSR